MPWWWCLSYYCRITCKATWPGKFSDPYAFKRVRWILKATLFHTSKDHMLSQQNIILSNCLTSFKWSIGTWRVRTLQIWWTLTTLTSQKQLSFITAFFRSTFAASWLPIIKVPQGNLLPKINFLAVSIQRNIYPFSPHFWAKPRYFCYYRLGAHFPAVCAVTFLSHQGCMKICQETVSNCFQGKLTWHPWRSFRHSILGHLESPFFAILSAGQILSSQS